MSEPDFHSDASPVDGAHEVLDVHVAQLEAYLDGELSADDAAAVRARVAEEPACAAALDRLHRERMNRVQAFEMIEAAEVDPASVGRLAAAARGAVHAGAPVPASATEDASDYSWPLWTKIAVGMAASIMVGFVGGLVGGYDFGSTPAQPNSTPISARSDSGTDSGAAGSSNVKPGGRGTWVYYDENGEPQVQFEGQSPAELRVLPFDRSSRPPSR